MNDVTLNHAVVTGGGTGIGAAIALALAQAGVAVTIAGRRQAPLDAVAAQHEAIFAQQADATDEQAVANLFEAAAERHGPIDAVIANAGGANSAPLKRASLADWNDVVSANMTSTFLTLREGVRVMDAKRRGRLICVASTAGLKGYSYVAAYCAAKHGVIGLVRASALELASTSITVNAICPGFTETPLLDASVDNIMQKTGMSADEARQALAKTNPQRRLIQPGEVAATALWLCADGADSITGQSISVSGGETT